MMTNNYFIYLYIHLFLSISHMYYSKPKAHCESECTYRSKYPKNYNNYGWMQSCTEQPCPFGLFDALGQTPGNSLDLQQIKKTNI